jgi:hypothetical protein
VTAAERAARWADPFLNLGAVVELVQRGLVCAMPAADPLHHLTAEEVARLAADPAALSAIVVTTREDCQQHR